MEYTWYQLLTSLVFFAGISACTWLIMKSCDEFPECFDEDSKSDKD